MSNAGFYDSPTYKPTTKESKIKDLIGSTVILGVLSNTAVSLGVYQHYKSDLVVLGVVLVHLLFAVVLFLGDQFVEAENSEERARKQLAQDRKTKIRLLLVSGVICAGSLALIHSTVLIAIIFMLHGAYIYKVSHFSEEEK